jgi:acetyl-CoA carboxylase carboxyltransferase component
MSKLDELRQKNEEALMAGGKEKIEAQHKAGKKKHRGRGIESAFDDSSFVETDKFLKRTFATPGYEAKTETGEGVFADMDYRRAAAFVYAQDPQVLSGSLRRRMRKK